MVTFIYLSLFRLENRVVFFSRHIYEEIYKRSKQKIIDELFYFCYFFFYYHFKQKTKYYYIYITTLLIKIPKRYLHLRMQIQLRSNNMKNNSAFYLFRKKEYGYD